MFGAVEATLLSLCGVGDDSCTAACWSISSTVACGVQSSCGCGPCPGRFGQVHASAQPQSGENFAKSSPHPVNPCRAKICVSLFSRFDADDLLIFDWFVARSFFHAFEGVDDIHAVDDFTEDGVVHVEPRSRDGCDEELAAVGAGACIGHGQKTRAVKGELADALILKVFAPDGLPAAACAGRIATLDHELFNDAVEDDAVVVAVFRVCAEVLASEWCDIVEQLEFDAALSGFDD